MNKAVLEGKIVSDIERYFNTENNEYYRFTVEVEKKKGTDKINVVTNKRDISTLQKGDFVHLEGEFRSKNNYKHLVLFFAVKKINVMLLPFSENKIELAGTVVKSTFRTTPLGTKITDLMVAINREDSNKSDYIPCICYKDLAIAGKELKQGDKIHLKGKLRSRDYIKDGETKTAFEVTVLEIVEVELKDKENKKWKSKLMENY